MTATEKRIEAARTFIRAAAAKGIEANHGGKKGHGYWMRRDGQTITNDGATSGNASFWMHKEAVAYLATI